MDARVGFVIWVLAVALLGSVAVAEADGPTKDAVERTWSHEVPLLILVSTSEYAAANRVAQRASRLLKVRIGLSDVTPNRKSGSTSSREHCEDEVGAEGKYFFARERVVCIGASAGHPYARMTMYNPGRKASYPDEYSTLNQVPSAPFPRGK